MSDAPTLRRLMNEGWSEDDCAFRFGLTVQQVLSRVYPTAGRVPLYTEQVSLKLDPETHAEILAMAKAERTNQVEIIRNLIQWGLDSRGEAA